MWDLIVTVPDHCLSFLLRNRIQNIFGVHDDLLTMMEKRKFRWYMYVHISRSSGKEKTMLQETVKVARRRRRQKTR